MKKGTFHAYKEYFLSFQNGWGGHVPWILPRFLRLWAQLSDRKQYQKDTRKFSLPGVFIATVEHEEWIRFTKEILFIELVCFKMKENHILEQTYEELVSKISSKKFGKKVGYFYLNKIVCYG